LVLSAFALATVSFGPARSQEQTVEGAQRFLQISAERGLLKIRRAFGNGDLRYAVELDDFEDPTGTVIHNCYTSFVSSTANVSWDEVSGITLLSPDDSMLRAHRAAGHRTGPTLIVHNKNGRWTAIYSPDYEYLRRVHRAAEFLRNACDAASQTGF